jgi:cyclic pyranopterin phosphate synthase
MWLVLKTEQSDLFPEWNVQRIQVRSVDRLPKLKQIGMTTNGVTLSKHLPDLVEAEDCAKLMPYQTKVNIVVLPDNRNELRDFCNLTRDWPIDVRFIEYMPFDANQWQTDGFVRSLKPSPIHHLAHSNALTRLTRTIRIHRKRGV